MGHNREALESYHRGLTLTSNAVELRYLRRRISELGNQGNPLNVSKQ
jgi:predicted RNA polymerase sigma factor